MPCRVRLRCARSPQSDPPRGASMVQAAQGWGMPRTRLTRKRGDRRYRPDDLAVRLHRELVLKPKPERPIPPAQRAP